jgi:hypothetical protein
VRGNLRLRAVGGAAAAVAVLVAARDARALDKQGSAHGGGVGGAASGFNLSGAVTLGSSLVNPSYAARPDNTGLALFRYAAHVDVDLIGQRLSIPLDVNMFTDRQRPGLEKLAPSELDLIGGVTSTWPAGPGAVEVGSRVENDRPVDHSGGSQLYADVRTRYLYSLASIFPGLAKALHEGDVSGWGTLGWFAYNETYFARPNNTGLAFLRYALHGQVSVSNHLVSLALDATMFTNKAMGANRLVPTELDLTPEVIVHMKSYELHVALETDRPLDAAGMGFSQTFLYALLVWSFDLKEAAPEPLAPPLEDASL